MNRTGINHQGTGRIPIPGHSGIPAQLWPLHPMMSPFQGTQTSSYSTFPKYGEAPGAPPMAEVE